MGKIAGVGEMYEGVIERDPLDETYQVRFLNASTGEQEVLAVDEILADYVGREVRFQIAFCDALQGAIDRVGAAQEVQAAVSFDDLEKGA
jgi:hypothetical protein